MSHSSRRRRERALTFFVEHLSLLRAAASSLAARDDGAPMPINSKHSLEEQLGLKKTMGQSYARMLLEVLAASAIRPRTPLSKASSTLASPMSEFRSVLSFFLVRSHVFYYMNIH